VLGSGCELDVARYALVGVDDRVHLEAAFLLPRLRIAPNTLENEVREGRCRDVDNIVEGTG